MIHPLPALEARISKALEAVYRNFAAATPAVIEGCPCCLSKRGVDILVTSPLRALTGDELWSYVSGVFLTVGSERDFRYLLPRILDIAINDPVHSNDPEIVLGKLALANWHSWPAKEREAIEALIDGWFERALSGDLAATADGFFGWEAEAVLCGIARAGLPIDRWIARLQQPDVAPILADLRQRHPDLSAFWEDVPTAFAQLSAALAR